MDSDYTNIQAQIETFNMSPEQENFSLAVLETCKKNVKTSQIHRLVKNIKNQPLYLLALTTLIWFAVKFTIFTIFNVLNGFTLFSKLNKNTQSVP